MKQKIILWFWIIILSNAIGNLQAAEYWISYTGAHRESSFPVPGGPKYLLKIDDIGNVIVPAQKVIQNSRTYVSPQGGGTALTLSGGSLQIWIPAFSGIFPLPVFRGVINRKTMQLKSFRKTSVKSASNYYLQATEKTTNNFLDSAGSGTANGRCTDVFRHPS